MTAREHVWKLLDSVEMEYLSSGLVPEGAPFRMLCDITMHEDHLTVVGAPGKDAVRRQGR